MKNRRILAVWQAFKAQGGVVALAVGAWIGCALFWGIDEELPWVRLAFAGCLAGGLGWVVAWRLGRVELRWMSLLLFGIFGFFGLSEVRLMRVEGPPVEQVVGKAHWLRGKVMEVIEKESENRATVRVGEGWLYGVGAVGEVRLGVAKSRISDLKPDTYMVAEVKLLPAEAAGYRHGYDGRLWQFISRKQWVGYVQGEIVGEQAFGPEKEVKSGDFWGFEMPFWGLGGIFAPEKGSQGDTQGLGGERSAFADVSTIIPDVRGGGGALPASGMWAQPLWDGLDEVRRWVKMRVAGMGDGVVVALLIGDKAAVERELVAAYRQSGLLHLMVISGLQLTLVAGGVFWGVRKLLACWPWLALRYNIKALAALAGIVAAGGYTLLIGWQVSILRAFGMAALGMVALVVGRFHMLVRGWALVGLGLLALWPEMAVNAGFQLSFAAVLGLIGYGLFWEKGGHDTARSPVVLAWLGHMAGTSVVASVVTAPILAFHFGLVSVVGVVANVVAIPPMIVATWLGFAGFLLAPVGGEMLAWRPMTLLVDGVNHWARFASTWPLAQVAPAGWPDVVVLEGGKAGLKRATEKGAGYEVMWGGQTRVARMWGERQGVKIEATEDKQKAAWETPVGWVVRVDDVPDGEDCVRAAMVIAGEAGGACPDRTLVMGTFAWAEGWQGKQWEVGALRCGRRWEVPFCGDVK